MHQRAVLVDWASAYEKSSFDVHTNLTGEARSDKERRLTPRASRESARSSALFQIDSGGGGGALIKI